jgi:APA family basic amino acid/polyamine antiporter
MVVSEVVGVGIFLAPAEMVRTLGSAWWALAVWLVMGVASALGAICYAELSTRLPRAGGAYVFLREAFGARVAFVYGWMSLLVVDPGLTAALGIGFAQYLTAATDGPRTLVPLLAVVSIVAFGLLTAAGMAASARILRWSALAKLAAVGVLVAVAVARAGAGQPGAPPSGVAPSALAGAVVAAFFAFGGWWDLGKMSEEVRDPRRTLPAALVGGVGLVTLIYALVTLAIMLGPRVAADTDEALVTAVGAALFGEAAGRLLAVIVVVAVAGSLSAVLLGAPRVYLAMARDGVFPQSLARLEGTRGALPRATLVQVALACALAMFGTFDQVLGFFVPAAVFFLGLSASAVLVLPRPAGEAPVFRAPGHPWPIALFLLLIAAIVVLFAVGQPWQTLLGAVIVLAGVPVSWYVLPEARPAGPAC